jgi:hypothetical protein
MCQIINKTPTRCQSNDNFLAQRLPHRGSAPHFLAQRFLPAQLLGPTRWAHALGRRFSVAGTATEWVHLLTIAYIPAQARSERISERDPEPGAEGPSRPAGACMGYRGSGLAPKKGKKKEGDRWVGGSGIS